MPDCSMTMEEEASMVAERERRHQQSWHNTVAWGDGGVDVLGRGACVVGE